MADLLVSPGCHSKVPQARGLTSTLYFQLEVQDQRVSRVGFSGGPFSWLAEGRLLAVPLHGLSPVYVQISSAYEDTS